MSFVCTNHFVTAPYAMMSRMLANLVTLRAS